MRARWFAAKRARALLLSTRDAARLAITTPISAGIVQPGGWLKLRAAQPALAAIAIHVAMSSPLTPVFLLISRFLSA
ncbi:hypothetical protein [Methyloversatilis discipulorum]|uniref:hypothetical protein n=1 Tax=Methyloversatilis discipulorum TaxID=1119528 RepID=UPI003137FEA3